MEIPTLAALSSRCRSGCRFEADRDRKPPNVAEYVSARLPRRFRQEHALQRLCSAMERSSDLRLQVRILSGALLIGEVRRGWAIPGWLVACWVAKAERGWRARLGERDASARILPTPMSPQDRRQYPGASDCEINGLDTTAEMPDVFVPPQKKEHATTFSEPPP
jgi:hypothetical protein